MKEIIKIPSIDEQYEKYILDNNLKVYVYSNEEQSEYYASFTTYYGSNFDEIPGTAHFLEHSLFTKSDGDIFKKFAENNASCNAFTSNHQTTYYFTSSDNFEKNFLLLQELVNDGYFAQDNVDKEMGIIEEEIVMYAQSSDTKIRNTTLKNACIKAKYGIDIAGSVESINTLTPKILKDVHTKYYVPSNQAIVMSGNFENIDVISLINQIADQKVVREEIIEDENINLASAVFELDIDKQKNSFKFGNFRYVYEAIEIKDINVDMFTHSFKFRTSESMEENIRDYISINIFLSTYFSHTNELYLKYKNDNLFTSLLEHSVIVTPSIKLLYFEMNYENNENIISEFLSEMEVKESDLIQGLTKIKAYEIRQLSNKKRLMESIMYSLSDDFEYDRYIEILFSISTNEVFQRITDLFTHCNEGKLIFKGNNAEQ